MQRGRTARGPREKGPPSFTQPRTRTPTIIDLSVSLDGFIAGPKEGPSTRSGSAAASKS